MRGPADVVGRPNGFEPGLSCTVSRVIASVLPLPVVVTVAYVLRTTLTLLRFVTLKPSAISCSFAPPQRPMSFVTRGSSENWLGRPKQLREKPGILSLRALPSLFRSNVRNAVYGWPVW